MKSYFIDSKVYHVVPTNESYRLAKYIDGKRRLVPVSKSSNEVENLRAISDAINVRLGTQRYSELIYNANYGVNWAKFIGRNPSPSLIAEISYEIREALMLVNNVLDCTVKIEQKGINTFIAHVDIEVAGVRPIRIDKTVSL